jgi:hypothetical protein
MFSTGRVPACLAMLLQTSEAEGNECHQYQANDDIDQDGHFYLLLTRAGASAFYCYYGAGVIFYML